jgi:hypothetical protein
MGHFARFVLTFAALVSASFQAPAFADEPSPDCLDGNKPLQIDVHKVIGWMTTTKDDFHARARVEGRIVKVLPDQTGHDHFLIELGPKKGQELQVVYNDKFGKLPQLAVGQVVEACGDYITVKNDPKIKAKGIIHWVHESDNPKKHEHGFLKIDGLVYGDEYVQGSQH